MSDGLRYQICKSCLEALRISQTVEYIHPAVLTAIDAEIAGQPTPIRLDPIRRN